MTIFFRDNNFYYKTEAIIKLFFPLEHFRHITKKEKIDDDFIITSVKKKNGKVFLWIMIWYENKVTTKRLIITDNISFETEIYRMLYKLLSKITGEFPPWGILTGVRPVSLLRSKNAELNNVILEKYFLDKMLVSKEKFELALYTAKVQQDILDKFKENTYSLYISIPFCRSRCSYCSFVSHNIGSEKSTKKIDDYIDKLCIELAQTAVLAEKLGLKLDTIYIGGGTPTAISTFQLKKVTDSVEKNFDISSVREYTIEAGRADSITKDILEVILLSGATRISVNPQSFNDEVLKKAKRNHSGQDAIDAYKLAYNMGFENINMDFIIGLEGDTLPSFIKTIDKAIELSPTNITIHTLSIKRSSSLFNLENSKNLIKEHNSELMLDYANKALIKSGYKPYYLYRQKNTLKNLENIGYTKTGFESIYNIYIMEEIQTILACGAGGVTKIVNNQKNEIKRIFNFKYHFEYIDRFDEILSRKKEIILT